MQKRWWSMVWAATGLTMAVAVEAKPAEESVPYKEATRAGVKQCLGKVKYIADFLTQNRPHGAHCNWSTAQPDARAFTCDLEVVYNDGAKFATMMVTPLPGGGCSTQYTVTFVLPESCEELRRSNLSGFTGGEDLHSEVRQYQKDHLFAYLQRLPGGGCLAIRREMPIEP